MLHESLLSLLALVTAGALAQTRPAAQSLDGLWLTDGYGELLEVQGDHLRIYEVTSVSCILATQETRKPDGGSANEIAFSGAGDTVRISPANSADTRWLHDDGSISNVSYAAQRRAHNRAGKRRQILPLPIMRFSGKATLSNIPFLLCTKWTGMQ